MKAQLEQSQFRTWRESTEQALQIEFRWFIPNQFFITQAPLRAFLCVVEHRLRPLCQSCREQGSSWMEIEIGRKMRNDAQF